MTLLKTFFFDYWKAHLGKPLFSFFFFETITHQPTEDQTINSNVLITPWYIIPSFFFFLTRVNLLYFNQQENIHQFNFQLNSYKPVIKKHYLNLLIEKQAILTLTERSTLPAIFYYHNSGFTYRTTIVNLQFFVLNFQKYFLIIMLQKFKYILSLRLISKLI